MEQQEKEITTAIEKYSLQNAIKFDGKANPGAIIGKIMGEFPEVRKDMKGISQKVNAFINSINTISVSEQISKLQKIAPELLEKKEKIDKVERGLPELKNAKMGEVITRIPPEPSKYNHVGHALSFLINYMYSKKYNGKCLMRFDDTNPEKESQEYVDAMNSDVLDYLEIKTDKTIFASDHMDTYYKYAQKLIDENKAYICFCTSEEMSKQRREMIECPHREETVGKTTQLWEKMKNGEFKEGECVLRLKIDMGHKNAVMRDPVIYRLCYSKHYRQGTKYKVWPMYDFETSIEEGLNGISHVLRSNEFDSRIELHKHIASLFGFPEIEYRHYGRFSIPGATTQGREIRALIDSGNYIGWDDPRLVTLRALKRRGIVKETYYELAIVAGLSKQETNLDYSIIASINRKILDQNAERFFFIETPLEIKIKGTPKKIVKLNKHPEKKDHSRIFNIDENFILDKNDLSQMQEGDIFRLMDCINFKKENNEYVFVSDDLETFKKNGKKIIHFISKSDAIPCKIMMADATYTQGFCEKTINELDVGAIIQFERFGFCRLDKKEGSDLIFWFGHK